jgi:hypothetical protein
MNKYSLSTTKSAKGLNMSDFLPRTLTSGYPA